MVRSGATHTPVVTARSIYGAGRFCIWFAYGLYPICISSLSYLGCGLDTAGSVTCNDALVLVTESRARAPHGRV